MTTPTAHDEMEAARLTASLGYIVTPDQVTADRVAQAAAPAPTTEAAAETWRLDVTDDERTWASNGLTFPDRATALAKGDDLGSRWFGLRAYRAVPSTTPTRQPYVADDADRRY